MSCPGALCRAPELSVSGPDAHCVGARRSLALFVEPQSSLCQAPTLTVSGLGALSLSLSGPGALCVGPRRSLSRSSALSRSLCRARRSLCWAPSPGAPRQSIRAPPILQSACHPSGLRAWAGSGYQVWLKESSWAGSGFQVWPKKSSRAGSGLQVWAGSGFQLAQERALGPDLGFKFGPGGALGPDRRALGPDLLGRIWV